MNGDIDIEDLRFLVIMACILLVAVFAAVGCAMQPFRDRRGAADAGFRWVRR
ncbi:hypothetical protein [Bradyrhizobium sp. RD5-C2]|uniref:hypothetical protein n=1 Tax=Bradyrhizobium sp. RD5-C2 TaxID=244562 RepID=UPI001CC3D12B|nr:hypothetical protein [Bradyrhizobium sp. RD5-C2]